MAFNKLVNLFALASLAVLVCSFSAQPVNALSVEPAHHLARSIGRNHGQIAKKKRSSKAKRQSSKRCVAKASSSLVASSTEAAPTSSSTPDSTPAAQAQETQAATTPAASPTPSPTSTTITPTPVSNDGKKVGLAWPNGPDPSLSQFVTSQTK